MHAKAVKSVLLVNAKFHVPLARLNAVVYALIQKVILFTVVVVTPLAKEVKFA